LADVRIADATALLAARRYAACYYLAGYAVECALKACIAGRFRANTIPDRSEVNRSYSHDLEQLVTVAGLQSALARRRTEDADFDANWNLVKDWNVDHRYRLDITRKDAARLLSAVTDTEHGVLRWLSNYW